MRKEKILIDEKDSFFRDKKCEIRDLKIGAHTWIR